MRFILLTFFITSFCFGQSDSQPQKESTSDLRAGIVMFSILDKSDETNIWLERTSGLDYFLKKEKDSEIQVTQKITTKEAAQLEKDFASMFLKVQYEIPAITDDCSVTLHLVMKGDEQKICKKEEKKTQEINSFLKEIAKKF